jgi:RNA polymerase sigma-70 factor (ECF subfamily)
MGSGKHGPAFDLIVTRYSSRVFRLCHAFLRDAALAEDAAQETFVRIWRAQHGFDGRAALSTWIYAIARNCALTSLRRRRPTESLSDDAVALAADQAAASTQEPGEADALRRVVAALPTPYRLALTLFYYEERSVAEVATRLGLPENTVKSHLSRGRGLLLQRLQELGLGDSSLWITTQS